MTETEAEFQFRWLKIKGIDVAFPISIKLSIFTIQNEIRPSWPVSYDLNEGIVENRHRNTVEKNF